MPWIYARFSLRVYITCLFSALIILLGGVLIYTQHRHNSEFIIANSQQRLDTLENLLSQRLEHSLQNINTSLALMKNNGVTLAGFEQDPQRWLLLLHPLLIANPNVVSFYVGEPDGRGLFFNLTSDEITRSSYSAPATTELVLDIMSATQATQRFYFDKRYQLIAETMVELPEGVEPFNVHNRPWFNSTLNSKDMHLTAPYLFHTSHDVGITLAMGDAQQQRVWAADLLLTDINAVLNEELPDAHTLLLQAPDFKILASSTIDASSSPLSTIQNIPEFAPLAAQPTLTQWQQQISGETWLGHQQALTLNIGHSQSLDLRLAAVVPYSTLMAGALSFGREQVWLALLIVLLCLPLVIITSRAISRPLAQLADDMKAMQSFDFNHLRKRHYFYRELDDQAKTITLMNQTLADFTNELRSLSQSDDFNHLLQRVAAGITHLADGKRCLIYRAQHQDNEQRLVQLNTKQDHHIMLPLNSTHEALAAYIMQAFSEQDTRFEQPWLLFDRFGKLNGAIMLELAPDTPALTVGKRRFIGHYSDFANIALEDMTLFEQQRLMTESMVRVLAAGIDAKSPHTSKHCQRVPEITMMLAQAAHDSTSGEYADFSLSEQQWEELYLASWLHDCGKLVTPEHLLNKATKLETLYNRLHEIRTRFEVLKRDADIRYWQGIAQGEPEAELIYQRQQRHLQLDEDFAFIAQLNKGDRATTPEQLQRLNHIATQPWLRTLDNRVGLSWEEEQRLGPPMSLPVWEALLADLPEHQISYQEQERIGEHNDWGITMAQPQLKQHLGERYNLAITHGTLTHEERYIINAHVVHTLMMLSELHYPTHLSNVPTLAASHHENMNGTGYPRGIHAAALPLQARIMTLADVFEALTASDRPYKKANSLQETLLIMANMVSHQHLDSTLFRFFIEQEIYLQYAQQYLEPEQIDQVNKQKVLATAGL